MKVKELIKVLQSFDPEHRVVVDGYEGGFSDVSAVCNKPIIIDENKDLWYYGHHETFSEGDDLTGKIIEQAILILR